MWIDVCYTKTNLRKVVLTFTDQENGMTNNNGKSCLICICICVLFESHLLLLASIFSCFRRFFGLSPIFHNFPLTLTLKPAIVISLLHRKLHIRTLQSKAAFFETHESKSLRKYSNIKYSSGYTWLFISSISEYQKTPISIYCSIEMLLSSWFN